MQSPRIVPAVVMLVSAFALTACELEPEQQPAEPPPPVQQHEQLPPERDMGPDHTPTPPHERQAPPDRTVPPEQGPDQ